MPVTHNTCLSSRFTVITVKRKSMCPETLKEAHIMFSYNQGCNYRFSVDEDVISVTCEKI
jgi:hypothetical protein